jgi:hypothetical protein
MAAVREDDENEENAASPDGVNSAECLAFEGMAPADDVTSAGTSR